MVPLSRPTGMPAVPLYQGKFVNNQVTGSTLAYCTEDRRSHGMAMSRSSAAGERRL
jgi:hypothetical protein